MTNPATERLPASLAEMRRSAAGHGLNLLAAVPVERYDALVKPALRAATISPEARSIIAIGNGGGALWDAFHRHLATHPGWMQRNHPLDDFTRLVIEDDVAHAAASLLAIVYPFTHDRRTLDFITLAKAAGLAGPSILGVAVHPTFGPWIAFRAALLLRDPIDAPGDAIGFDPCPTCTERPCMNACPAGAIRFPLGWDVPTCVRHRVEHEADCADRCHARAACVLGPEHAYAADELAYHQQRALAAMRAAYASLPDPR